MRVIKIILFVMFFLACETPSNSENTKTEKTDTSPIDTIPITKTSNGRLVYSTDAGATWNIVELPESLSKMRMNASVYVESINSIWIAYNKTLYHYIDESSWQLKSIDYEVDGLQVFGDTIYAQMQFNPFNGYTSPFRSIDGGKNFINIGPTDGINPYLAEPTQFITKDIGFTTNLSKLYKTIDAGTTWEKIYETDGVSSSRFDAYSMLDDNYGVLIDRNIVLITSDGFKSSDTVKTNIVQGSGNSITANPKKMGSFLVPLYNYTILTYIDSIARLSSSSQYLGNIKTNGTQAIVTLAREAELSRTGFAFTNNIESATWNVIDPLETDSLAGYYVQNNYLKDNVIALVGVVKSKY